MSEEVFTETQLKDMVATSYEGIKEHIAARLLDDIKNQLQWKLKDKYAEIIGKFIEEHIQPQMEQMLIANKAAFLNGLHSELDKVGAALGAHMHEKFLKTLKEGKSWDIKKVYEALL